MPASTIEYSYFESEMCSRCKEDSSFDHLRCSTSHLLACAAARVPSHERHQASAHVWPTARSSNVAGTSSQKQQKPAPRLKAKPLDNEVHFCQGITSGTKRNSGACDTVQRHRSVKLKLGAMHGLHGGVGRAGLAKGDVSKASRVAGL